MPIRNEDILVGKRIRQRRNALSLTQAEVADRIGVKFQQLQKYETGANRVSASRLCDLAEALDVAPHYFFKGVLTPPSEDELRDRDEIALLRSFRQSPPHARQALLNVAQATAQVGV